jgi:hypothetical protein
MRLKSIFACVVVCLLVAVSASAQTQPNAAAFPFLKAQFFTSSGLPLANGKLYFYVAGTATPQNTYTTSCSGVDIAMCTTNANPVVLDSGGRASVFLGPVCYKVVAQNFLSVQQWTMDNICDLAQLLRASLASSITTLSFENIKFADQQTGSTVSAKINAALAATSPFGLAAVPSNLGAGDPTTFPNGASLWDLRSNIFKLSQGVAANAKTNSTVDTPLFYLQRYDNSPPVGNAGLFNSWYAPMVRLDLNSTSGGVTGSSGILAVTNQFLSGKSYTVTTGAITSSGSPQSVAVTDSSMFVLNDVATIDDNTTSVESFTVTAVPDGTHVSGIFANNHSSGASVGVNGKGTKSGLDCAINDVAGSTNDMNCLNPNVLTKSAARHNAVAIEADCGNSSGVAPNWYASTAGPFVVCASMIPSGAQDSTVGAQIIGAGARFLTDLILGSARNTGLAIVNNGAGSMPVGIAIAAGGDDGIIIGSNQTAPADPAYPLADPTHGIELRSKGTGATAQSNDICWQERVTSTNHLWCIVVDGSGNMGWYYDSMYMGTGFTADAGNSSHFSSPQVVVTAKADDSNPGIYVSNAAGNTVVAKITNLGDVIARTAGGTAKAFAGLPTCNGGMEGQTSAVTDSNTNTWGANIAGGGGNHVGAYCNGAAWTVFSK